MALSSIDLTTTIANLHVATSNIAATVIYVANYSATDDATFTVHLVANGSSASSTNVIYNDVLLSAGDTYVIDSERLLLSTGDTIQISVNANSIASATLSYTTV